MIAVFDLEATGTKDSRLIQVAVIFLERDDTYGVKPMGQYASYINPEYYVEQRVLEMTKTTKSFLRKQPKESDVFPAFWEMLKSADTWVGHSIHNDLRMLQHACKRQHVEYVPAKHIIDTQQLFRQTQQSTGSHSLRTICEKLGLPVIELHDALTDAACTAMAYLKMSFPAEYAKLTEKNLQIQEQIKAEALLVLQKVKSTPVTEMMHPYHWVDGYYQHDLFGNAFWEAYIQQYHLVISMFSDSEKKLLHQLIKGNSYDES